RLTVNRSHAFWAALSAVTLTAWVGTNLSGPRAAAPPAEPKADRTGPSIRLNEAGARATADVTGRSKEALAELARLAPGAARGGGVLGVYVDRGKALEGQPSVLGTHRLEKGALVFEPRFPLERGVRYRAVLRPAALPGGAGARPVEVVLSLPRVERPPTT